MIGPHADACLAIIGESGAALVPRRLAVPAVPEDVALLLVREDAVEPRAVRRANCRLQLRPLAAIDVVQVVAVLREELAVAGVEGQAVAAGLQFGNVIVALPVLVAGQVVGVEAKVVGAFEVLLGRARCETNNFEKNYSNCE